MSDALPPPAPDGEGANDIRAFKIIATVLFTVILIGLSLFFENEWIALGIVVIVGAWIDEIIWSKKGDHA